MRIEPRSAKEILTTARGLLSEPQAWIQKANARNTIGASVFAWSDEATCWCSSGAVEAASDPDVDNWEAIGLARETLSSAMGQGVIEFNDTPKRQHHEVIEAFDKAIKELENDSKED